MKLTSSLNANRAITVAPPRSWCSDAPSTYDRTTSANRTAAQEHDPGEPERALRHETDGEVDRRRDEPLDDAEQGGGAEVLRSGDGLTVALNVQAAGAGRRQQDAHEQPDRERAAAFGQRAHDDRHPDHDHQHRQHLGGGPHERSRSTRRARGATRRARTR